MGRLIFGRHLSLEGDITTVPERAAQMGYGCFQVFLGSPQRLINKKKSVKELEKLRDNLESYKMLMVIHGNYTLNFASPLGSKLSLSSINSLVSDLSQASVIGERCLGVIIHMGKNIEKNGMTDTEAYKCYISSIQEVLGRTEDSNVILETGASQGKEIGSRLSGLSRIYRGFSRKEKKRIKFCIDTCHIWASGYDISSKEGVDKYLSKFDNLIGLEKIALFHFNDSQNELNSHKDRHADLGYGKIGKGLRYIARFSKKRGIPLIMETHLYAFNQKTGRQITYEDEIKKLKSLVK